MNMRCIVLLSFLAISCVICEDEKELVETGVQTSRLTIISQDSSRPSTTPSDGTISVAPAESKPVKQKTSTMDFLKQIFLLWQLKERFLGSKNDPPPMQMQNNPQMMNHNPQMMNGNPQMMNGNPRMMNRPMNPGMNGPMYNMNRPMNGNFFNQPYNMPMNNYGGGGMPMNNNQMSYQQRPQRNRGGGGSLNPNEILNMMNTFQAVQKAGGIDMSSPQQHAPPRPPIMKQANNFAEEADDNDDLPPPPRASTRQRRRTVDWVKESLLKFTNISDRNKEDDIISPIGRRSRGKSISSMLKMFPLFDVFTPFGNLALINYFVKMQK